MISDSEIPKYPEFEVKSKIGKNFKKHNPLEEYSVKIYEIDSYFYEHYEKKYKLIIMGVNIYYLELIFILVSVFQQQKLMKKDILIEKLFLKKKDKKHQKKKLIVNLLELIQVMQKWLWFRLCTSILGNVQAFIDGFKNKKVKKLEKQSIKEKEMREKLEKQLIKEKEMREKLGKEMEVESRKQNVEIKELKDKNKKLKNLTNNQVTNNFGKIIKN